MYGQQSATLVVGFRLCKEERTVDGLIVSFVYYYQDTIISIEAAAISVHLFTHLKLVWEPTVISDILLPTYLTSHSEFLLNHLTPTYVSDQSCDLHMTCYVTCIQM